MRKLLLFAFLFICIYQNANTQVVGGTYEKLAKLYNQGKYENCLFKADNLTYKPESTNDAEPYLYIAMCFYQLSLSEDPIIQEDYSDGVKQAIKYAARFIKKDKEGVMYTENIEFINLLKEIQKNEIKTLFDKGEYRKAATSAKLFDKLNKDEDLVLLYFIGINGVMSNNLTQGTRDIEEATTKLNEVFSKGTYKTDPFINTFAISGFLKYSEYMVNQGNVADALKQLEMALKIYPNDGYLKLQYNVIKQNLENKTENKE